MIFIDWMQYGTQPDGNYEANKIYLKWKHLKPGPALSPPGTSAQA